MSKPKQSCCESCMNNYYDEEYEEYACMVSLDEDELYRLLNDRKAGCPYYRPGDDYSIVRKQN